MKKVLGLSINDLRNIQRDPMMLAVLLGPVLLTIAVRYGIPQLGQLTKEYFQFSLLEYSMLILCFFMLLIPFLIGILTGLLILDDRDEQMIVFYSVTPLGRNGYLLFRLASPILLSFIFTFVMGRFNGLVELGAGQLLVMSLLFGLEAPLIALVLANVASNKVEGLAATKGLGVLLGVPFLVALVHSNWVWLAAALPTFWSVQAFLAADARIGSYTCIVIGCLLVHGAYLWAFMKRFAQQSN